MRIHNQAENDINIEVPTGYPLINVKEFQRYTSLDEKPRVTDTQDALIIAVDRAVKSYDAELIPLPLAGVNIIYFQHGVYNYAYAELVPILPVNNQHTSTPVDPRELDSQVEYWRRKAAASLMNIAGFRQETYIAQFSASLI